MSSGSRMNRRSPLRTETASAAVLGRARSSRPSPITSAGLDGGSQASSPREGRLRASAARGVAGAAPAPRVPGCHGRSLPVVPVCSKSR